MTHCPFAFVTGFELSYDEGSFFTSCNGTAAAAAMGDKLSSNRRCRKTPKTLVSQVLLPLKTKGKDKNEGFTYTVEDINI